MEVEIEEMEDNNLLVILNFERQLISYVYSNLNNYYISCFIIADYTL